MGLDILKRKIVCTLLFISIGFNMIMGIELYHNQAKEKSSKQEQREDIVHLASDDKKNSADAYTDVKQLESREDYLADGYKNNPIDTYIDKKLAGNHLTYAQIRDVKRLYFMLWKSEYDNIIHFLKEKCEDNEDKNTVKELDREIETYVEKMSYVFGVSYDNSLGLSAWADTLYNKGEIYRDICMYLIEKSNEEYVFMEREYDKIVVP